MTADISRAISSITMFVDSQDSYGKKYRQIQEILSTYHLDAQLYIHEESVDLCFAIAGSAPYHVDEYTVNVPLEKGEN